MQDNGYCCLIITGDDLDIDFIESTLGIEAAEKWKKGEIIHKHIGEAQRDFMRFGEKINEKYNPDQALTALLDKLIVHEEFLKNLKQKACIYILCYIQSDYAQIHYTLSAETLNKIARLGIELNTDILSWGGVEDKKDKKKSKKGKKKVIE